MFSFSFHCFILLWAKTSVIEIERRVNILIRLGKEKSSLLFYRLFLRKPDNLKDKKDGQIGKCEECLVEYYKLNKTINNIFFFF